MRRLVACSITALAVGVLGGCWESPDVTVHRTGEYKGAKDPLLAERAVDRGTQLAERFELVQSDR